METTVRQRIELFLERQPGRAFCDLCVRREMRLRSKGQISAAVVLISRTAPSILAGCVQKARRRLIGPSPAKGLS